jgi:hypothetical protein
MADTAQNLRAFLVANAGVLALVSTRVHQGAVPQADIVSPPYIWLGRASRRLDRTLGESTGAASDEEWYDVEAISDDLDESQSVAAAIRAAIECYRGTLGTQTVKGVFCEDQSDQYIPRGTLGEESLHVSALSVQIFT